MVLEVCDLSRAGNLEVLLNNMIISHKCILVPGTLSQFEHI